MTLTQAIMESLEDGVLHTVSHFTSWDHMRPDAQQIIVVVNQVPHVTSGMVPFHYVIVATKNIPIYGPSMVDVISPAISPKKTTVVLIQNGIHIERPYIERFPQNVVLSGVSYAGSQEVEHGKVSHGSHDILEIGAFRNPGVDGAQEESAARHFVSLYAASGKASCLFTPQVQWCRWKKLVYNASVNPLCAITGLDTGSLRQAGPYVVKLLEDAMTEIVAAAAAAGHTFPKNLPRQLLEMDRVEDRFQPSMLQDVKKVRGQSLLVSKIGHLRVQGNFIEYEYLVGEPLREGTRLGIPMPVTSVLYAQCVALQYRLAQGHQTS